MTRDELKEQAKNWSFKTFYSKYGAKFAASSNPEKSAKEYFDKLKDGQNRKADKVKRQAD